MWGELFAAGIITTIAGSLQEKKQVKSAKIHADDYFRRTNAEREAILKADQERIERRQAREKKEAEWKAQQAKKATEQTETPDVEQEILSDGHTIHIENINISSGNIDTAAFDKIFEDFEKIFSEKG